MPGVLLHSPARIVHQLLVDQGVGASSGRWTTKTDGEADSPDDVLTIYNTASRDDGWTQFGEQQTWNGVQVRVRSSNPETGLRKANDITQLFDVGLTNGTLVNVDGTQYNVGSVHRTGDVLPLGNVTGSKRSLHTIDCLVSVTKLPLK